MKYLSWVMAVTLCFAPTTVWGIHCTKGKPCGGTCIEISDTCHVGGGTSSPASPSRTSDSNVFVWVVGALLLGTAVGVIIWYQSDREYSGSSMSDQGYSGSNLPSRTDMASLGSSKSYGDLECRGSEGCYRYGQCSYANGQCVTLTDEDCLQSLQCKKQQKCRVATPATRPLGFCVSE